MTADDIIDQIRATGVILRLDLENMKIKVGGKLKPEHKDLLTKHKDIVVVTLLGENPDLLAQKKLLIHWGYSEELVDLMLWSFQNDHKWPIEPFYLKTSLKAEPFYIGNPKAFYSDIGLATINPDHDWIVNGSLKAYLQGLKDLVDNQ